MRVSPKTSKHALVGIGLFALIVLAVASRGIFW